MLFGVLSARGRSRRNLASAFIGEIVAAMDSIEECAEIKRLESARSGGNESPIDFHDFHLPRFAVYEANANQLGLFNPPLPRELAYFYTRLGALPKRLRELTSPASISEEETRRNAQDALNDVNRTMQLGEDLLRSIKEFVSNKRPDSISRA